MTEDMSNEIVKSIIAKHQKENDDAKEILKEIREELSEISIRVMESLSACGSSYILSQIEAQQKIEKMQFSVEQTRVYQDYLQKGLTPIRILPQVIAQEEIEQLSLRDQKNIEKYSQQRPSWSISGYKDILNSNKDN